MKLPNRIKRDEEIDALVIKAYRLHPNIGTRTLAEKFKLSRVSLRKMLRKHGEPPKKSTGGDRGFPSEVQEQLNAIYKEAEILMNRQILIRFGNYEHQKDIKRECLCCKEIKPFTKEFFSRNFEPNRKPHLRNVCIKCFSKRGRISAKKKVISPERKEKLSNRRKELYYQNHEHNKRKARKNNQKRAKDLKFRISHSISATIWSFKTACKAALSRTKHYERTLLYHQRQGR